MKRTRTKASASDWLARPSITPDELFKAGVMPLSRNLIYAACNSGEIDCIRIGRKIVIPTAPLRRKLGMEVV